VTAIEIEPVKGQSRGHAKPWAGTNRSSGRLKGILKHVALILTAGLMLYPLLWMIASSFRPEALIFKDPSLIPTEVDTGHYADGWTALANPFHVFLINSAIIVAGSLLGNLLTCSMAAYAFAKLEFRGRGLFFGAMLLTLMLPMHVVLVPQYVLFSNLDWVNTFLPLKVQHLVPGRMCRYTIRH